MRLLRVVTLGICTRSVHVSHNGRMKTQRGRIELRGTTWLFRYRERVLEEGRIVSRPKSKKLASKSREYPDAESVRPLADLILAPILTKTAPAESRHTLSNFVEHVYLPEAAARLKPSTAQTYRTLWRLVGPYVSGKEMREYRTSDVDKMLAATVGTRFSHNTNKKVKAFLSAIFCEARRLDFCSVNPVVDARLPKGKTTEPTEAYTLDEVVAMLKVLPEPGRTAVLVAALTGLRVSEIKGLRWEDYTGDALHVRRSVWQGKVSDTKTITSAAPVPVVGPVRDVLAKQRKRVPSANPWIFPGDRCGRPLRLENTLRREMLPALEKAKIEWRGWHAFRRGVGTILNGLGVDSKTIQTILRHARVETTQAFYVRPVDSAAKAAMSKLSAAFAKKMR